MSERTVLFVDDEEKILKSLERGLIDAPYRRLFASSGKEALEILEREEVHIIVTDMRMPGMSGIELLRIVKDKYPQLVRLALSGYTQVGTLLTAINQGEIYRFMTKPWKLESEFKDVIEDALNHYEAQESLGIWDIPSTTLPQR